jgi:hypothetical protein
MAVRLDNISRVIEPNRLSVGPQQVSAIRRPVVLDHITRVVQEPKPAEKSTFRKALDIYTWPTRTGAKALWKGLGVLATLLNLFFPLSNLSPDGRCTPKPRPLVM